MRHGKSQDNQDDLVSTPQTPLTKEGESQARKTGRDLRGKGIVTILTSPFPRAQKTAEIIAAQLKLAPDVIKVVDDLRERGLGQLEGHKHEHKHAWYFTIEGEADVEPRGMLIARCESALSSIKKAAVDGPVLVVGHTICGYYLYEVAAGKRLIKDFNDPKETSNGGFKRITIAERPKLHGIKVVARVALILMFVFSIVLLIWGVYLTVQGSLPVRESSTQQSIPLSQEEYNSDPLLQKAVNQALQEQDQVQQSGNDASNQLQPTATLPR